MFFRSISSVIVKQIWVPPFASDRTFRGLERGDGIGHGWMSKMGTNGPGVTKLWRAKRMLRKARPRPVIVHGMKRGRILLARSRLSDSWQKLAWLDGWPPPPSLRDKSPTWREDSTLQVVTPEYLKPLYVKFFPLWRCETEVFTVLQL